jgi:UDP-2,4-diacetamido-2,4,6-trideoxy-beta-L-altropyranose hydrolase
VDHYELGRAFEAGCRPWAGRILAIDDLASRRHDADYLLDQTPARVADDYRGLVPPACKVLAGASYALLRPEFARAREEAMRQRGGRMAPGRILMSVGASDPARVTEAALNAVRESGLGVPVDVIVGAADQRREAIEESLARLAPSSRLHVDPSVQAMVELMMQADLAVGAGGVSALERCCLGLPSLLLVLAGNQAGNAAALRRMGAVRIASLTEGAEHPPLSRALLEVAREPAAIAGMSRAAAAVCDGLGAGRVAAILDEAA